MRSRLCPLPLVVVVVVATAAACEAPEGTRIVDGEVRCGESGEPSGSSVAIVGHPSDSLLAALGEGANGNRELVNRTYRSVDDESYSAIPNVVRRQGARLFDTITTPLMTVRDDSSTLPLADVEGEAKWREVERDAGHFTYGFEYFNASPTFSAKLGDVTEEGDAAPDGSWVVDTVVGYQIVLVNIVARGGNACAAEALRKVPSQPTANELVEVGQRVAESDGQVLIHLLTSLDDTRFPLDGSVCSDDDLLGCIEYVGGAIEAAVAETRSDEEMAGVSLRDDPRWRPFSARLTPLR